MRDAGETRVKDLVRVVVGVLVEEIRNIEPLSVK